MAPSLHDFARHHFARRAGISCPTMTDPRADEIVTDLLRSAWIVEQARAEVFELWARPKWAERAREQADIVAAQLRRRSRNTDDPLVEAHTRWITNLAGSTPGEEPLGEIFVARLGDWVQAHIVPFLTEGGDRLAELGDEERSQLSFPDSLPEAPPFEPVPSPSVGPPGPRRLRFVILGDTHFGSRHGESAARAAIKDINASGPDLVIQLGDLTDHGDRNEFELALQVLSEIDAPLVTMMGNHDVYSYKEERLAGREYYPASFGREPDGVLLDHEGVKFGILDSVEHETSPFAPFDLLTGTFTEGRGGAIVRGTLTPSQHDLLADLAAPGAGPAFIFLHHPVQPFTGFPPVVFGLRDEDSGRLHATVDSGNIWGVFAGHTHRNARTRSFDGVPAQEVAIPRDFPFGFAIVDVSDDGYAYRFVQISDHAFLEPAYKRAGSIHRRYALGTDEERAFVWSRGPAV